MPEDLKLSHYRLFSAAASIQGISLSRSKKTLSKYFDNVFLLRESDNFIIFVCYFRESSVIWDDCFILQDIRDELLVDKNRLSATLRKLSSASDRRPSAQATGGFGIFMLVIPAVLIVLLDIVTAVHAITKTLKRKLAMRKDKPESVPDGMNAYDHNL